MTAREIITTLDNLRYRGRTTASKRFTERQWLFLADMVRARLLSERAGRYPNWQEGATQLLPPLPTQASNRDQLLQQTRGCYVGPIPRPLELPGTGAAFVFVGEPGGANLKRLSLGQMSVRRAARAHNQRLAYVWDPSRLQLNFTRLLQGVGGGTILIEAIFTNTLETEQWIYARRNATRPSGGLGLPAPTAMPVDPFSYEYPLSATLTKNLIDLIAQMEKADALVPDLDNDGSDAVLRPQSAR